MTKNRHLSRGIRPLAPFLLADGGGLTVPGRSSFQGTLIMWKKILFAVVIGISVLKAEGQNVPQPEAPKEADVLRENLFAFGSQDDAKQALAVIRKYGFTEIAYVGSGVPVMIVWVAGPDKSSRPSGASPLVGNPGKAPGNETYQKALAGVAQLHPRQLN